MEEGAYYMIALSPNCVYCWGHKVLKWKTGGSDKSQ